MAKKTSWDEQETRSDSQEESVVDDLKEKSRLLNLEADIEEAGADQIEEHGVDTDLVDMFREKVPGKRETARETSFVAKILERTRKT